MNKTIGILAVAVLVIGGGFYLTRDGAVQMENADGDAMVIEKDSDSMMEGDSMMKGEVKEFMVEGSSFAFAPSTMTVKKGDTVRVTFKNVEGLHDFVIDEFNARTKQIKAGGEETIEFVASEAGTFEYYCSVGNHRAQGMVGTLTVTE